MTENDILKCVACGINDEEAIQKGIILENTKTIDDIKYGKDMFKSSDVFGHDTFICSNCKRRFSELMKVGEIETVRKKSDEFAKFIDISSKLMELNSAVVFEACLFICIEQLKSRLEKNPYAVSLVLKGIVQLFNTFQNEAERRTKIEKRGW